MVEGQFWPGSSSRSQCPLLEASACDLWMQLSSSCAVKCLSKRALGAGLRHIPVLLLRQLLPSTRARSAVPLSLGGSQSPRESGGPRARAQMSLLLKGWMEWRRSLWPRHAHRQPRPSSYTPRASPPPHQGVCKNMVSPTQGHRNSGASQGQANYPLSAEFFYQTCLSLSNLI